MSEKEKTGASGASLVVVEKTRSSRHKPFPPKDPEADTSVEVHHKLSKPAVHSAVTVLKDVEETLSSDYKRTEKEHKSPKKGRDGEAKAVFSKMKHKQHHHHHSKPEPSSEAIALTAVDAVEVLIKNEEILLVDRASEASMFQKESQPIPSSHIDLPPSSIKVTHSHESIADVVTELRTDIPPAIASSWASPLQFMEISPEEPKIENQPVGDILCDTDNDKGSGNFLVQKSSFGPYIYRRPQREPSGIAFCIAQKSAVKQWTESKAAAGIVFSYHKFKQQSIGLSTGDDGDECNFHVEGKHKSDISIPEFTDDSTSCITSLKSDSEDSVVASTEAAAVKNSKWKSFLHYMCRKWK